MSQPEGQGPPRNSMSRRDLLRRGAIVGGLVWAAPVIQSLRTPAYALSPGIQSCCVCKGPVGFQFCFIDLQECSDCQAFCAPHGGVKTYSQGTNCGCGGTPGNRTCVVPSGEAGTCVQQVCA